jgi:hypothetical protein
MKTAGRGDMKIEPQPFFDGTPSHKKSPLTSLHLSCCRQLFVSHLAEAISRYNPSNTLEMHDIEIALGLKRHSMMTDDCP